MYSDKYENLDNEQKQELSFIANESNRRHNLMVEPGHNDDVSHVRMTIEDIRYLHRPLLLYIGSYLLETLFELFYLRWNGFVRGCYDGQTYWYHKRYQSTNQNDTTAATATSTATTTTTNKLDPIVILHGITPGWRYISYIPIYIYDLARSYLQR